MTENMDRENTMFEVEDSIDKIKFLLDDFMEQYGFNDPEKNGRREKIFLCVQQGLYDHETVDFVRLCLESKTGV